MTQSFSTKLLAAAVRAIRLQCKADPSGKLALAICATGSEFRSRITQCGDTPDVFIGVPTGMHMPLIDLGMVIHETQIENRWNVTAHGRNILRKLGYGKIKSVSPAGRPSAEQESATAH